MVVQAFSSISVHENKRNGPGCSSTYVAHPQYVLSVESRDREICICQITQCEGHSTPYAHARTAP